MDLAKVTYAELYRRGNELSLLVDGLPRSALLDAFEKVEIGEWPKGVAPIPDGWETLPAEKRHFALSDAHKKIADRIPLKERKRHERRKLYGESEEQFQEWWESQIVELLQRLASLTL